MKEGYRFRVNFNNTHLSVFGLKILSKYTHSRTYLENRNIRTGIYGVCNRLSNIKISQKVLTEIFFRLD